MTMQIIMWTLKSLNIKIAVQHKYCRQGVARLISWLNTAGPLHPLDCFNKSVSDCYIRVYWSFLTGYSQLLVGPTQSLGYAPKMRYSTNLQVYLHDHAHQLEYSKQYRFCFQRIQWLKTNTSSYSTLSIYVLCLVLFSLDYWTRSPIRQSSMLSGLNPRLIEPARSHQLASLHAATYILHLASGTVRQWLRARNLCIFSTKINPWTTSSYSWLKWLAIFEGAVLTYRKTHHGFPIRALSSSYVFYTYKCCYKKPLRPGFS